MAKGYWIASGDIVDFEAMKRYRAANQQVLQRYGAKFLVVGGQQEAPEGEVRSRQTLVEFDSYETALACYNDPEYQAAAQHRKTATSGTLVIVQGFEMPPAA